MTHATCPNCHHHSFDVKPVTGSSLLDGIEKVLIKIGIPETWFKNILVRCRTCKAYWRA